MGVLLPEPMAAMVVTIPKAINRPYAVKVKTDFIRRLLRLLVGLVVEVSITIVLVYSF